MSTKPLLELALWPAAILGLILVLWVAVYLLAALRWRAKGHVNALIAEDERIALLTAIQEASTEPKMRITLSNFWKYRGWNRAQRLTIIKPLLDSKRLHRVESQDNFEAALRKFWHVVLHQPPGTVILNTRDWTRMANDNSGNTPRVIIREISGGQVSIGTNNQQTQNITYTEAARGLASALRKDSAALDGEDANKALELSSEIDAAAADPARLQGLVERTAAFASATDKVLTATKGALTLFG